MATRMYTQAVVDMLDGTIDIDTDTIKIMLVGTGYTFDPDHTVIDNGGNDSTDPSFNEISATDYTGGFGGAGRKTLTIAVSADTTNDRAVIAISDVTWTGLGGASNDTVAAGIVVKEITNDTASRLIGYIDFTDTATTDTDFVLDFPSAAAGGTFRFTV